MHAGAGGFDGDAWTVNGREDRDAGGRRLITAPEVRGRWRIDLMRGGRQGGRTMYIPAMNRVEDPATVNAFIHAHGFATLVTQHGGVPFATHVPVLFDEEKRELVTHIARANEQWRHFAGGAEALCMFHGPHAYISPSWYASKAGMVPTWNYAAVHVYGVPEVIEEPAVIQRIVVDTTTKYESKRARPWTLEMPQDKLDGMLRAIVGVRIAITRVEAKFKLGQNRLPEDRAGMLAGLEAAGDADSAGLAAFIRAQGSRVDQM